MNSIIDQRVVQHGQSTSGSVQFQQELTFSIANTPDELLTQSGPSNSAKLGIIMALNSDYNSYLPTAKSALEDLGNATKFE